MIHPKILEVMRGVLRERGLTLGDGAVEEECLRQMAQRVQETAGLRLMPWITSDECRPVAR